MTELGKDIVIRRTEQEYSEGEIVTSTLTILRKIRGFPLSLWMGDPDYTPAQVQQFLLDAERIGMTCAQLLIDPLDGEATEERVKAWLSIRDELDTKYSRFPSIPTGRPVENSVHKVLIALPSLRKRVPDRSRQETEEALQFILNQNETGLLVQDLYNNRLVVFSPLSADYLEACLVHRVVETLTPSGFRLKPIILTGDRLKPEPVAMPDPGDWMIGINEMGAFVENNTSYGTLKATLRAMRGAYPELR